MSADEDENFESYLENWDGYSSTIKVVVAHCKELRDCLKIAREEIRDLLHNACVMEPDECHEIIDCNKVLNKTPKDYEC